jgi:L-alanine-DL-glutamate epimerase-like enolase superfamily enzyme
LAKELTVEHLEMDANGEIRLPDKPGLGLLPNIEAIKKFLVDVRIEVKGQILYETPDF